VAAAVAQAAGLVPAADKFRSTSNTKEKPNG
jgi:hypothetical protein